MHVSTSEVVSTKLSLSLSLFSAYGIQSFLFSEFAAEGCSLNVAVKSKVAESRASDSRVSKKQDRNMDPK